MKTTIYLMSALFNVAGRYKKAIWREREINTTFRSVSEMRKMYNIKNCNYRIEDENGNTIIEIYNGKLDCYGTRYN